jgi:hypothetical protein
LKEIKKMMRSFITLVIFSLCSIAQAQDFKQVIRELRRDYAQSKALEIVMEVTVYDSTQSPAPFYQQRVEIRRSGDNYWYQVENNEMLLNEKCLVVVDKEARQISYSKRSLQAEAELQKNLKFDLDSILGLYDSPRYLGKADGADHYLVHEKGGPIKDIHFYIAPGSRTLKQIAYKYSEGQYASIRFVVFNRQAVFKADTFSEQRYVTAVNDRIVPSRFFKDYNLNY